jgi:hypothetical protein
MWRRSRARLLDEAAGDRPGVQRAESDEALRMKKGARRSERPIMVLLIE